MVQCIPFGEMDGVFIPCPSLLRSSRGTRSIPCIIFVIILFVVAVVVSIVVVNSSSKKQTSSSQTVPLIVDTATSQTSERTSLPESANAEEYFNFNGTTLKETTSTSQ